MGSIQEAGSWQIQIRPRSLIKDLLAKQAQLNATLDLDKHEAQVVAEAPETAEKSAPAGFAGRVRADDRAAAMAP